jgi:hypothetical protein
MWVQAVSELRDSKRVIEDMYAAKSGSLSTPDFRQRSRSLTDHWLFV